MKKISPFLRWAGGKRWLVSNYSNWISLEGGTYIEPFLGSGAVFFHLSPESAIISDLNTELIATYNTVKKYPVQTWRVLQIHHELHCKDYYYAIREKIFDCEVLSAARFIYLNRTCFNGLYRVNLKGLFNVPKGTKDHVILPTDDFTAVSKILQNAQITSQDFEQTIAEANAGDLVYVDPPYTVKHNKNGFIKYNEKIFSWNDQQRLSISLLNAARRGAKVLISNANHESIHQLYADNIWQHHEVSRNSTMASSSTYRKGTSEIIISNYLDGEGNLSALRH